MEENIFNKKLTRRELLKYAAKVGIGAAGLPVMVSCSSEENVAEAESQKNGKKTNWHEAYYYKKIDENTCQCEICPRRCWLEKGMRSFCRVKEVKNGKLYTAVYAIPCAVHVDPIEKKPIYHMLPGSGSFSIATAGCNARCKNCQNWQISQASPEQTYNYYLPPKEVVKYALEYNCRSIAYTYTEPTAFYEYMLDTAKLAKKKGIKNVYVTNTYINKEPLKELCKYLDATNADLKGFDDNFLTSNCALTLEPTLEALKLMKNEGVLVEVTHLIIPTLNDNMKLIKKMCIWLLKNLGSDTPLHFSRFYPAYKLRHLPQTPVSTLEKARNIALEVGLKYVYIGNVGGHEAENTYCPNCKKILIRRVGYSILFNKINKGKCSYCNEEIPGIWT